MIQKFLFSKNLYFIILLFLIICSPLIKKIFAQNIYKNKSISNDNLFADLSDQFKKQQADIWNDYNRCVDIYNSAEYIWSGYLSSSSGGNIVKNRPRIILDSKNGKEYLYRVVINENRLIGLDHNQRYSFEEKCFQPVDQGLWKILIGKTYNLDRKYMGLSRRVDLQYVWNDNQKKDFLKTYIRTPGSELKEKILIKKCSIKVKQSDLFELDEYGKYSKLSSKANNYQGDTVCMNYEKKDGNVRNKL